MNQSSGGHDDRLAVEFDWTATWNRLSGGNGERKVRRPRVWVNILATFAAEKRDNQLSNQGIAWLFTPTASPDVTGQARQVGPGILLGGQAESNSSIR